MVPMPQDQRALLNSRWLRIACLTGLLAVVLVISVALRWERSWYVTINWTESLTHWAFVVDKNEEPAVGDFVDFQPPANPYYANINFVKMIVAGPGDTVECDGRSFMVDGVIIAIAKTHSQAGDPLSLGPCGIVPDDHFFVVATHKDSFDSRYGDIGHVARSRINGVARPIL